MAAHTHTQNVIIPNRDWRIYGRHFRRLHRVWIITTGTIYKEQTRICTNVSPSQQPQKLLLFLFYRWRSWGTDIKYFAQCRLNKWWYQDLGKENLNPKPTSSVIMIWVLKNGQAVHLLHMSGLCEDVNVRLEWFISLGSSLFYSGWGKLNLATSCRKRETTRKILGFIRVSKHVLNIQT